MIINREKWEVNKCFEKERFYRHFNKSQQKCRRDSGTKNCQKWKLNVCLKITATICAANNQSCNCCRIYSNSNSKAATTVSKLFLNYFSPPLLSSSLSPSRLPTPSRSPSLSPSALPQLCLLDRNLNKRKVCSRYDVIGLHATLLNS